VADSAVISDVSTTLVDTLNAELATLVPAARAELNDLTRPAAPQGAVLTITLYEILEDGHSRNRGRVREPDATTIVTRKPPMALLLRYLMTPWAGDQQAVQQIAGRTLQVLYDDAILDGLQLRGDLLGSEDSLKVTLAPLTLEERARVWYAIQKPYRLSLNYEIRVVNLDALGRRQVEAVQSRTLDWASGGDAR
jgi:hypothetical protein